MRNFQVLFLYEHKYLGRFSNLGLVYLQNNKNCLRFQQECHEQETSKVYIFSSMRHEIILYSATNTKTIIMNL